jgi:hypothetical protein
MASQICMGADCSAAYPMCNAKDERHSWHCPTLYSKSAAVRIILTQRALKKEGDRI